MISLIFAIIFFMLFIFFCIAGGNYMLRSMVENALSTGNKENFNNFNGNVNTNVNANVNDSLAINAMDECSKNDMEMQNVLNFQTGTNIPQSPNYYKNYIGSIFIDENINKDVNNDQQGMYCMKKSKLLYDGIWDPKIKVNAPYETQEWTLTNGNLTDGYYCSDKMIEINKPFPKNYIDDSATPPIVGGEYYTYFNDTVDDVFDTEIHCFNDNDIFLEGKPKKK